MNKKLVVLSTVLVLSSLAYADSITHGSTTINMEFANIGYADNVADIQHPEAPKAFGAVAYNYRIGKFEVTATQWASVLSADSNIGNAGSWDGSQPTATASCYEAMKFANWLTTGNAYSGAYQFDDGGTLTNSLSRAEIIADGGLFYIIPDEDEWYKAAYFKSDGSGYTVYASGNSLPLSGAGGENYNNSSGTPWDIGSGISENNGTYDMTGNVWEWCEGADFFSVFRGGAYTASDSDISSSYRNPTDPLDEYVNLGFRVAAIPEPSTAVLFGLVGGLGVFVRKWFMP